MAVIGAAVAIFAEGAAEFGNHHDNGVAPSRRSDLFGKSGQRTPEFAEAVGKITGRSTLVDMGIPAADIDKALKLGLNHPMGPFELVDLVGLDTRLHILEYLHKTLGEKFRPAPLLVQYVKAGRLGKKSGRGVYEYPDAQPK